MVHIPQACQGVYCHLLMVCVACFRLGSLSKEHGKGDKSKEKERERESRERDKVEAPSAKDEDLVESGEVKMEALDATGQYYRGGQGWGR